MWHVRKCLTWQLPLQLWSQRSKQVGTCPGNTLSNNDNDILNWYLDIFHVTCSQFLMENSNTDEYRQFSNLLLILGWLYVSISIFVWASVDFVIQQLYIKKGELFGVCKGEPVPYKFYGLKSKKDKNGMLTWILLLHLWSRVAGSNTSSHS